MALNDEQSWKRVQTQVDGIQKQVKEKLESDKEKKKNEGGDVQRSTGSTD